MLVGSNPCPYVDLENSPCREVCSVPHTRIRLFGRVETCLEDGNNQVERWVMVRVTVEPPNGPRKAHGRVDSFGVGDASEDPTDTARIVPVLSPNILQIPYTQS